MPLQTDRLVARLEPLHRLRRYEAFGYAVAVVTVAAATLLRLAIHEAVVGSTFVTYFPAVMVTTAIGRLRAGLVAVILVLFAASFLFIPPSDSFLLSPTKIITLLVAGLMLAFVAATVDLLQTVIDDLMRRDEELRSVLHALPIGVAVIDEKSSIVVANRSMERQFGYDEGRLAETRITDLVPDARDAVETALTNPAHDSGPARDAGIDVPACRRNGTQFPAEIRLTTFERNERRAVLATIADHTDRRIAEKEREILAREVQHRARNLLSIIETVATRILSNERPLAEARQALLSTLGSFRRTHEILSVKDSASLKTIAVSELSVFPGSSMVQGCDVWLKPSAAMNFTLMIHELCVNAAKHGALSIPGGQILLEWRVEDSILKFDWTEMGGPVLQAQPARAGFGTTLLREIPKSWGAEVSMQFAPQGFKYSLSADRSSICEPHDLERELRVA